MMTTRTIKTQFETTDQKVSGYAIRFNAPTQITEPVAGKVRTFQEIIRPGALRFQDDLKLLWGHDSTNVLGSTKSGTIQTSIDDNGLQFTGTLPESAHREREALARGDVDGCSFGFQINKEKWDGNNRELLDISVYEISIVAFPAYPQTSVGLRSRYEMELQLAEKSLPEKK